MPKQVLYTVDALCQDTPQRRLGADAVTAQSPSRARTSAAAVQAGAWPAACVVWHTGWSACQLRTLKTLPASRASVSLLKASPSVNA